jgi:hypothetical protein
MLQKCTNFVNNETEAAQILRLDTHVDEIVEVCKIAIQCLIKSKHDQSATFCYCSLDSCL